jgi:hypothetical protein
MRETPSIPGLRLPRSSAFFSSRSPPDGRRGDSRTSGLALASESERARAGGPTSLSGPPAPAAGPSIFSPSFSEIRTFSLPLRTTFVRTRASTTFPALESR